MNQRILGEDDFYNLCDRFRVPVYSSALPVRGVYVLYRGKPSIWLNERLQGQEWLFTAWHEFGHHLLHAPPQFRPLSKLYPVRKYELEADAVAMLALWPVSEIEDWINAPPARRRLWCEFRA